MIQGDFEWQAWRMREALKSLILDLDGIGFGDEDSPVSGFDCVDIMAEWLPRLKDLAEGRIK